MAADAMIFDTFDSSFFLVDRPCLSCHVSVFEIVSSLRTNVTDHRSRFLLIRQHQLHGVWPYRRGHGLGSCRYAQGLPLFVDVFDHQLSGLHRIGFETHLPLHLFSNSSTRKPWLPLHCLRSGHVVPNTVKTPDATKYNDRWQRPFHSSTQSCTGCRKVTDIIA